MSPIEVYQAQKKRLRAQAGFCVVRTASEDIWVLTRAMHIYIYVYIYMHYVCSVTYICCLSYFVVWALLESVGGVKDVGVVQGAGLQLKAEGLRPPGLSTLQTQAHANTKQSVLNPKSAPNNRPPEPGFKV